MFTIFANDFTAWREKSRHLLNADIAPEAVVWLSQSQQQQDLFTSAEVLPPPCKAKAILIPAKFIKLAECIVMHRDESKWQKLYTILWRLTHGEKNLLAISVDPLMHDIYRMVKQISRDAHKMKAFVRFVKVESSPETFIAWHQSDHFVLRRVAPFFKRRFAVMRWTIMTPDETAHWDGETLSYAAGVPLLEAPPHDTLIDLWQTYYQAIFNPARIKLNAMRREMPVRYWPNLPETKMIPAMLQNAEARVTEMMKHQEGFKVSAADFLPEKLSMANLKKAAENCKGCPLHKDATQTVFGSGNTQAPLMLIGEQPGDREDLAGQPFVGPAGKLLRRILDELEIDENLIYMTNAVKHFKFIKHNNMRMHRSPGVREMQACKPWLQQEINLINPQVILCLGATAAKSLIRPAFHITKERGRWEHQSNYQIAATYHPSAILRGINPAATDNMLHLFKQDLLAAVSMIAAA